MTKFVAVVSGKGGVGKTTVALNTALALNKIGKRVTLVDANFATPNLCLHFGIVNPEYTLNQFLRKEKSLPEITYKGNDTLSFLFSSPSYNEYSSTNFKKIAEIFEHLDNTCDFVIIDSPSGMGDEVERVLKHCDEALIVVNPTLSSVIDALKTIQLASAHNNTIPGIVLNMSNYGWNELKAAEIEKICGHQIVANIKYHRRFRKAAHQQQAVTHLYPRSFQARAFAKIGRTLSLEI